MKLIEHNLWAIDHFYSDPRTLLWWRLPTEILYHKGETTIVRKFNRLVNNMEFFIMPRKYQQAKEFSNASGFRFVNTRLTAQQASEFREWAKVETGSIVVFIAELLGDGYKLSLTYDHNSNCYVASLTGHGEHAINPSLIMTSRSNDWQEAVMLNAYKHFVIFQGKTWETTETNPNWG